MSSRSSTGSNRAAPLTAANSAAPFVFTLRTSSPYSTSSRSTALIARRRDPRDRRRQLIKLTPAGTKRLRRAEAAVAEAERELLSPLSAEERRELYTYLERVAEHACRPSGGWCS